MNISLEPNIIFRRGGKKAGGTRKRIKVASDTAGQVDEGKKL